MLLVGLLQIEAKDLTVQCTLILPSYHCKIHMIILVSVPSSICLNVREDIQICYMGANKHTVTLTLLAKTNRLVE